MKLLVIYDNREISFSVTTRDEAIGLIGSLRDEQDVSAICIEEDRECPRTSFN